jgi:hypothetical protein
MDVEVIDFCRISLPAPASGSLLSGPQQENVLRVVGMLVGASCVDQLTDASVGASNVEILTGNSCGVSSEEMLTGASCDAASTERFDLLTGGTGAAPWTLGEEIVSRRSASIRSVAPGLLVGGTAQGYLCDEGADLIAGSTGI